jgi:hypothetical protein
MMRKTEVTKKRAREYGRVSKKAKGKKLNELAAMVGGSRANIRWRLRADCRRSDIKEDAGHRVGCDDHIGSAWTCNQVRGEGVHENTARSHISLGAHDLPDDFVPEGHRVDNSVGLRD